jgi:hypothetical protein
MDQPVGTHARSAAKNLCMTTMHFHTFQLHWGQRNDTWLAQTISCSGLESRRRAHRVSSEYVNSTSCVGCSDHVHRSAALLLSLVLATTRRNASFVIVVVHRRTAANQTLENSSTDSSRWNGNMA